MQTAEQRRFFRARDTLTGISSWLAWPKVGETVKPVPLQKHLLGGCTIIRAMSAADLQHLHGMSLSDCQQWGHNFSL